MPSQRSETVADPDAAVADAFLLVNSVRLGGALEKIQQDLRRVRFRRCLAHRLSYRLFHFAGR